MCQFVARVRPRKMALTCLLCSLYCGKLDHTMYDCFIFSDSTIFAFHHDELVSEEEKCPYLFDLPLVVCGEVGAVLDAKNNEH